MLNQVRRRLTYANVMATIAVFGVLGGGAYAAGKIGTKDLKNRAVATKKVKKKAVKASLIANKAVKPRAIDPAARPRSSPWLKPGEQFDFIIDGSNLKVRPITAPEITPQLLTTHDVHVYVRFGGRTYQLPYTSDAGGKTSTIDYYVRPGGESDVNQDGDIFITRYAHDDSGSLGIAGALDFRYVIVPRGPDL